MAESDQMAETLRAALERRPEVKLHQFPIEFTEQDGVLVLSGEVDDIAAKRIARLEAVRLFGAHRVFDRLRVRPLERRGDDAIANDLYQVLQQELALHNYKKVVQTTVEIQEAGSGTAPKSGEVILSVQDGVVTLDGVVESLSHKRLVDVLAWWVRGTREVINRLHLDPEERDTDDEVTDALRMVLEKDPGLDAGQIKVKVRDRMVTLEGLVFGEEQSHMATLDAWMVLGVHGVDNRLMVQRPGGA